MDEEPVSPKIIPCKYCGQNIPETTNFCWYCGRELIARPERPESTTPTMMSRKTMVIIFFTIVAAIIVAIWAMYGR